MSKPLKPGSATVPMFGVRPALLESDGTPIEGAVETPGQGVRAMIDGHEARLWALAPDGSVAMLAEARSRLDRLRYDRFDPASERRGRAPRGNGGTEWRRRGL